MSVCVIGAGLAGLATAVRIKLADRGIEVIVIDGRSGNNTRMAGQRFRSRMSGESDVDRDRLADLLASRNGGVVTAPMREFARLAPEEIRRWQDFDPAEYGLAVPALWAADRPEWFGPQFGRARTHGVGRGGDVLAWFTRIGRGLGVGFVTGEVVDLHREGDRVTGAVVALGAQRDTPRRVVISTDVYVLAGGSPGGRMFLSTNAKINHSPQELAYTAGFTLTDAALFMFHILGNCNPDGSPRTGCLETDPLAGGRVYLRDAATGEYTVPDPETTALLAEHQAHYHFPDIARRFLRHGGVARVVLPHGAPHWGRVSHHYSHLAVATVDGVAVTDSTNLIAVGDAAGTGYWSAHQVRYPGVALAACLLTARLAQEHVVRHEHRSARTNPVPGPCGGQHQDRAAQLEYERLIRAVNTEHLLAYEFSPPRLRDAVASTWLARLTAVSAPASPSRTLFELSALTALACRARATDGCGEPVPLDRTQVLTALEQQVERPG